MSASQIQKATEAIQRFGEAWAIRKAWPEAAYDIQTRSAWEPR